MTQIKLPPSTPKRTNFFRTSWSVVQQMWGCGPNPRPLKPRVKKD